MDASVATVGLFLLVSLIGLLLRLWSSFCKIPEKWSLFQLVQLDGDYGLESSLFLFKCCWYSFVFASVKGPRSCGGCFFSRASSSKVTQPGALDQTCVMVLVFSSICLCLTGSTVYTLLSWKTSWVTLMVATSVIDCFSHTQPNLTLMCQTTNLGWSWSSNRRDVM